MWKTVHDSRAERPETVDTKSSPSTVYLRKNVAQVEVEDENGTHMEWVYQQNEISWQEYTDELKTEISELQAATVELAEMIAEV